MNSYIVCLEGSDSEFLKINKLLESYSSKAQIMKGSWIIVTDDTPTDIRNYIASEFVGRIAIFKTDRAAAWRNVMCDNNWIKDNLL